MIIKKNDDGTYLCESNGNYFTIRSKENYLIERQNVENIPEPTIEQLIEIGRQNHDYYVKDQFIVNIDNQLNEIEMFESNNNIFE